MHPQMVHVLRLGGMFQIQSGPATMSQEVRRLHSTQYFRLKTYCSMPSCAPSTYSVTRSPMNSELAFASPQHEQILEECVTCQLL